MKIKVSVDKKLCIGSGNCIVLAAKHFSMHSDGKAEVIVSKKNGSTKQTAELEVSEKEKQKIVEAAMACPSQAISIHDESGKPIEF